MSTSIQLQSDSTDDLSSTSNGEFTRPIDNTTTNSCSNDAIVAKNEHQLIFANDVLDIDDSTNTKLQMSESCPDEATTSILITNDAANASHSTAPMNQAEKLFEYEWPPKSGERYFLQEQLAEYLDIKSFKRKYPDLTRHSVEIVERDYLVYAHQLNSVMNDYQMQGLTAIRAIEVHELMSNDYPLLYSDYQRAAAERIKRQMAEQQRELDVIKLDRKKMDELRKKAIKSAFEFNSEMQRERKRERDQFWDLQTSIIQSPTNRWKQKKTNCSTSISAYPVALMPGQYHDYVKRYSTEELRKLPLNTVSEYNSLLKVKRPHSPPAITVDESLLEPERTPAKSKAICSNCKFCLSEITEDEKYAQCAQCQSSGHAVCMEMSDEMWKTVQQYQWMCMDCKPCSFCSKLDEEEKMVVCDRCDRGYHTFCVGLDELPSGRWICQKFCKPSNEMTTVKDGADSTVRETKTRRTKPRRMHRGGVSGDS